MGVGDSEPEGDVRASVGDGRRSRKAPRRPVSQVLAELEGVRRLRDESIRANRLKEAGELSQELEQLTQEYGRQVNLAAIRPPTFDSDVPLRAREKRRDAPRVRPPL